ncbi:putative carbonic anhydrase [Gordonia effusa NBRC 100432]|uniref:carbonic anhydrase n=1 Tax=Gordonia effusa NBRC 100432 TaxID=1077974 RepID=H0QYY9_9ACTN|nr:bifunctional SulP family inorganic anion transporter/carbonic anhydrase [Gordonia effusa]GAB18040.1 putative carbonic anhydrase [Gordonia effusa NBRC 100432]
MATTSSHQDTPGHTEPGTSREDNEPNRALRSIFRYDLPASIVVFLVALPLSIGIAIASGAPVMAGLLAAIVGGVVVGAIGGSPLQVSGPAAGLTVVVATLIDQFGWQVTCFITVAAGVLQILFGLSRIARAALAIAPVVVHAMLAGIGITIALQQVHVLLGGTSQSTAWENITAVPSQLANLHVNDLLIGAAVIAILLGWKYLPTSVRRIPGPLAAIVIATAAAALFGLSVERITLDGSLLDAVALPSLPQGAWGGVAVGILTVALIASVESLLSAVAVDKLHTGPRSNFDRELIGQGSANVVSGMIGGLPVTGVIVRSSTNVASGAKSRASAILHGFWILVFSVALVGLVQQIPKSALAGLLIVIGIQLVKLAHIRTARRTGDLWVYGVTVAAVVFLNLLEGVLIGLALAVAILLWRIVRVNVDARNAGTESEPRWFISITGSSSFLALPRLTRAFGEIPTGSPVRIELDADYLDHAFSEAIEDWTRQHRATGGTVEIVELGSARIDASKAQPPRRSAASAHHLRDALAPWNRRHRPGSQSHPPALRPLLDGVDDFHSNHADLLRPHLTRLADSQDPDSFFLTCSDSRVVPNVITASGPGDLFTVRNVGNLVPVDNDVSVDSALAFAIDELNVSSVIICGHSGCGAMNALLSNSVAAQPIQEWLGHAEPSLSAFRAGHPVARAAATEGFSEVDQLAMVNVAIGLQTLQRHAVVGRARAEGRVRIAGLFFDIGTARVLEVTTSGIRHLADDADLPESESTVEAAGSGGH